MWLVGVTLVMSGVFLLAKSKEEKDQSKSKEKKE
jgi:hypothetical protein